jgi:hypothetical protein
MGAKKGTRPPNAGKGRPKGSLNKSTKIQKEVFAELFDEMSRHFKKWIYQVAEGIKESEPILDLEGNPELDDDGKPKMEHVWLIRPDPDRAMKLALEAAEFHKPKLSRAEHVGENGGAIKVEATVEFVAPPPRSS